MKINIGTKSLEVKNEDLLKEIASLKKQITELKSKETVTEEAKTEEVSLEDICKIIEMGCNL